MLGNLLKRMRGTNTRNMAKKVQPKRFEQMQRIPLMKVPGKKAPLSQAEEQTRNMERAWSNINKGKGRTPIPGK